MALDYLDLYLKNDVLLLAYVFQKFWNMVLECYGLDPCHFLSRSGLSWDTTLKMVGIKSDPLTDVDIYGTLYCNKNKIWSSLYNESIK